MARQFPSDVYQQLTGNDFRLLDELTYLSRNRAKKGRSAATYCYPSRTYLSGKLGCSIRTVSRCIARLKRLGILEAIQRRPVRGIWQTNLYRVRHWMGWRLGQIGAMLRGVKNRVVPYSKKIHGLDNRGTRPAEVAFPMGKIETPQDISSFKLGKDPLIQKWLARGNG